MRARRVTGITLCCRTEKNVILLHNICVSTIDYAIQSFPTLHSSLFTIHYSLFTNRPFSPQAALTTDH